MGEYLDAVAVGGRTMQRRLANLPLGLSIADYRERNGGVSPVVEQPLKPRTTFGAMGLVT